MSLRVCIDARVNPGISGGLEQWVLGLASGLSNLSDGDEEYLFLVEERHADWLAPYLGGPARALVLSAGRRSARMVARACARPLWHAVTPTLGRRTVPIPRSPGLAEAAGAQVVHFPTQRAFVTDRPSIYQPWDLQYLHLPEFFTPRQRLVRRVWDAEFCARAATVAVASEFGRDELVRHLEVDPAKIAVIPVGVGASAYPPATATEVERTRRTFDLPDSFMFYPAQTWPHKNHLRLLEALALLRDRGVSVPLVCSGHKNDFYAQIERRVAELKLTDLVSFVGFVDPAELRALYALARAVVFPTLFEGGGMPSLEAFMTGVPLACSNVTCLPEQVGDAAVTFDPQDAGAIASAVAAVWTDEELRRRLVERGRARVGAHSLDRVARLYRAEYRRLAGYRLPRHFDARTPVGVWA